MCGVTTHSLPEDGSKHLSNYQNTGCVITQKPRNFGTTDDAPHFYRRDARTERQLTWFSSLPPSVAYQTISASLQRHFQFVIRHETGLPRHNNPQYSSFACCHWYKLALKQRLCVWVFGYDLLRQINACENVMGCAVGGKVTALASGTCCNYSGYWLLQAHDLLHVQRLGQVTSHKLCGVGGGQEHEAGVNNMPRWEHRRCINRGNKRHYWKHLRALLLRERQTESCKLL